MNASANPFAHYNPVTQMIKDKKSYSKQVQEILKEETCRQMTFEQFLKISKFEMDVP